MNFDVRLGVDRVGETGELRYTAEVRDEIFVKLSRTNCTANILDILEHKLSMACTKVALEHVLHRRGPRRPS